MVDLETRRVVGAEADAEAGQVLAQAGCIAQLHGMDDRLTGAQPAHDVGGDADAASTIDVRMLHEALAIGWPAEPGQGQQAGIAQTAAGKHGVRCGQRPGLAATQGIAQQRPPHTLAVHLQPDVLATGVDAAAQLELLTGLPLPLSQITPTEEKK